MAHNTFTLPSLKAVKDTEGFIAQNILNHDTPSGSIYLYSR